MVSNNYNVKIVWHGDKLSENVSRLKKEIEPEKAAAEWEKTVYREKRLATEREKAVDERKKAAFEEKKLVTKREKAEAEELRRLAVEKRTITEEHRFLVETDKIEAEKTNQLAMLEKQFFLHLWKNCLDFGINTLLLTLTLESRRRYLFLLMSLFVNAHLRFLTKRRMHTLHKDSLRRHVTHNLEQPVSTDRHGWTMLLLRTDVSGMLAPTEAGHLAGLTRLTEPNVGTRKT